MAAVPQSPPTPQAPEAPPLPTAAPAPAAEPAPAPVPTPTPSSILAATAGEASSAPPAAPPAPVTPPRFDAAYLHNPPPSYPVQSRRLGEKGKVILRVLVTHRGTPERVELRTSSGSQRLDDAARDAVQRWQFVPAQQGDTPVSAWVLVPILFTLEG